MAGKSRTDWNNIIVKIVPADKVNPNPLNPYAKLSQKEREREIISILVRIWTRITKEKISKEANKPIDADPSYSA